MSFFGTIIGSVFIGGVLLTLLGPIVFAVDRHALRQANITAFRRGVLMVSSQCRRAAEVVPTSGTLRTTDGEGQWLSDDVFGFWSVANYRRSSYYFGWVGTATTVGHEVLFEVRLLRGVAIQQVGSLLSVSAFGVLAMGAWQTLIVVLPIATAFLWWAWRALQQERSIATQIVKELSRKFEGGTVGMTGGAHSPRRHLTRMSSADQSARSKPRG